MKNLTLTVPVLFRLGLMNVMSVFLYRFSLKTGYFEKKMPAGKPYGCAPFNYVENQEQNSCYQFNENAVSQSAKSLLDGRFLFFSHMECEVGSPPDWFTNPIHGSTVQQPHQYWVHLHDFLSGAGDIKILWELSRFSWALDLARAYRLSGNKVYLDCLNQWITDWTTKNPFCIGPNWKCGQETGLRMLHLLTTSFLLNQDREPSSDLVRFVTEHCRRIEPTLRYALSQDNNHGTSEAAALFVGGTWLAQLARDNEPAAEVLRWQSKGRHWMENRVNRLIGEDGTFSQYSVVYHRVLVDTLNIVEFWRRELNAEEFSGRYYKKSRSAIEWLLQMIDPVTGDVPNLGANDGAFLFKLHSNSYRDFRPSVQLGSALFFNSRFFPPGSWDEPIYWLGLSTQELPKREIKPRTRQFRDGGYVVFKNNESFNGGSWGLLRYPSFRFRPNHADGLHLDLWNRGVNILRDSGSYSYNTVEPWRSYFSSTSAHNTVELDSRDQMPKVGRFIRGAWLEMESIDDIREVGGKVFWSGAYKDYEGGRHKRTVEWEAGNWIITDQVEGVKKSAVLRWRLAPGNWQLKGNCCVGGLAELSVESSKLIQHSEIVEGWESRYYLQKSVLPVWEVRVDAETVIFTTRIKLK